MSYTGRTDKLYPPFNNRFGLWKVTTEGDCEGKTIRNLGIWRGDIDDIALFLANKVEYSLTFSPAYIYIPKAPTDTSVNVTLDINSNTWELNADERAKIVSPIFKGKPVIISPSNYYGAFKITSTKETLEEKRKRILQKLTDEEKEILGLK